MHNMINQILSNKDLTELSLHPDAEHKSIAGRKISEYYGSGEISLTGKKLAEDIFRIMVKDVEIKVREALSESLKNCKNIPQDIVEDLINDKDSVAVPFIKYYQDLSSEDLINILEMQNLNKQIAVAGRADITEDVSKYIVDECPEEVVGVLISNDRAIIVEDTYQAIINKYGNSDNIKQRLVYRSELPTSVIEKIVNSLSAELQKRLIILHNLPNDLATNIVEQVQEKTTLKISEEYSTDKQVEELVHQLYTSNRLTSSLVVRAICMGDLKFFEYALVYLSDTPITEVRKILFNTNMDFMIRNLLRKAYIPKSMFPAVFSALKVTKEIRFDCRKTDRKSFAHKVIERILSYGGAGEELSEEDVNYLISKIS